jgi:hypothetical protein
MRLCRRVLLLWQYEGQHGCIRHPCRHSMLGKQEQSVSLSEVVSVRLTKRFDQINIVEWP